MREARLPGFRGWAVGFALMTDQGGHVNGTPQGKDESNDPYAYLRGVLPESESASYLPPTDDVLDAVPADNDEGTRRSRRQAISRRELRAGERVNYANVVRVGRAKFLCRCKGLRYLAVT